MKVHALASAALIGATIACAQDAVLPLPPRGSLEHRLVPAKFRLERVVVEGVSALPDNEVAAAVQPFVGRLIGGEELREMLRIVDALYESKGYVGTRAGVDDQPIVAGTLRLRVKELRLEHVEVSGNFWNRKKFIEWAIRPPSDGPLHLPTLQERLARLKESGLFARINADLRLAAPEGEQHGLRLEVAESMPLSISASIANNRAPSVGSVRREIAASHRSLLGWGDTLAARLGRTRGVDDSEVGYTVPVPLTPLAVFARRVRSDSLAIDPPAFRDLDIVAVSDTDAFGATASLLKTERVALSAGISRERRETVTYLLGIPFSFTPGLPDGPSHFFVTRVSGEGAWRTDRTSYFLRAAYSAGRIGEVVSVPGGGGLEPRFNFVQASIGAVRRLDLGELRLRLEGQHAAQSLPPIERLAIGGSGTVRGYRENLLLRDTGAIASAEFRASERELTSWAKVVPILFVDAGWGRNHQRRDDALPERIASAGVGFEATFWSRLRVSAAFARASRRTLNEGRDLQDRGIHFAASISYP